MRYLNFNVPWCVVNCQYKSTRWQDECDKTSVDCQPQGIDIYGSLYFFIYLCGSLSLSSLFPTFFELLLWMKRRKKKKFHFKFQRIIVKRVTIINGLLNVMNYQSFSTVLSKKNEKKNNLLNFEFWDKILLSG